MDLPFGSIQLPIDVVLDVEGGVVCERGSVDVEAGPAAAVVKSRAGAVRRKRVTDTQSAAHRLRRQQRGTNVLPFRIFGRLKRERACF